MPPIIIKIQIEGVLLGVIVSREWCGEVIGEQRHHEKDNSDTKEKNKVIKQ